MPKARKIADRRLASGEIGQDEHREILRALDRSSAASADTPLESFIGAGIVTVLALVFGLTGNWWSAAMGLSAVLVAAGVYRMVTTRTAREA